MISQEKRLKEHLFKGRGITRLSALTDLGIFELSSRLIALERQGIEIKRKWIEVTNRFGEKTRVKEYWINDLRNE